MARLPVGTLVRIDKNVFHADGFEIPHSNQAYVGEVGKVVHISPDWLVRGVPTPHYKLRMKDGKYIYWIDEHDLSVVGFVTS